MRRIDAGARPTSRSELTKWYSEALAAQVASGLSVADFARRLGVSVPTLYQWRRRLGAPGSADSDGEGPSRLVEVTVARPALPATDGMVVRLCAGRRSIEVPRDFDDAELRRLVAALESC